MTIEPGGKTRILFPKMLTMPWENTIETFILINRFLKNGFGFRNKYSNMLLSRTINIKEWVESSSFQRFTKTSSASCQWERMLFIILNTHSKWLHSKWVTDVRRWALTWIRPLKGIPQKFCGYLILIILCPWIWKKTTVLESKVILRWLFRTYI